MEKIDFPNGTRGKTIFQAGDEENMSDLKRNEEMLLINIQQKEFYEIKNGTELAKKGNMLTKMWRKARRAQIDLKKDLMIEDAIFTLHREWLGNYKNKDVLDFGCYNGNPLSMEIAKNAKSYYGIDLSESAIDELNLKMKMEKIINFKVEAIDFLSTEFQTKSSGKFDIIYAHSVIHHFKYFDILLQKLSQCLKENGIIIAFDPLESKGVAKWLRKIYRPFQSDKEWEYPLTKDSIGIITKYFSLEEIYGIMGETKKSIPFYFINKKIGRKMGKVLYEKDKEKTTRIGKPLYNCLQITMKLQKKEYAND